jgi:precorrin-6B methylase 2
MKRTRLWIVHTMSVLGVAVSLAGQPLAQAQQPAAKPQESLDRVPDSVYVGTPHDILAKMLEMAAVTKDDLVYDLGCGDGRIVVAAAKKYGCRAVGYDIDPVRIRESLENVKRNGVEKLVKIERRDLFTLDLQPASVIMLYLLPEMNLRLIPQLQKLKDGSRIVAHDYEIGGMAADKTITVTSKVDGVEHHIFFYKTPLKKDPAAEDQ